MAARALLVLGLWLALLDFPKFVAGPELDRSWQQALGYFCTHRLQAGVDYIFTYGPLGYFTAGGAGLPVYDAELFWPKYAWEVLIKLAAAVAIVRAGWRIPHPLARVLFLALAFLIPAHPDALYPFFVLLLGLAAYKPEHPSLDCPLGSASLLAVLALTKFNLFVFCLAAVLMLVPSLATAGRWRAAGLVGAVFAVCLAAGWLLAGQELGHLPAFLRGAGEVAAGYSEAMAHEGSPWQTAHGLVIVALLLLGMASCGRQALRPRSLLLFGFLGLALFLQWKHSFVRQGFHTMNFFAFAALLVLLFPTLLPAEQSSRWQVILAGGIVILGLVGRFAYDHDLPHRLVLQRLNQAVDNARTVVRPSGLRDELEAEKQQLRERWALPQTRAAVGDSPIDQGVLLLNDLSYRPRPVFQGYSAYTPYLLEANACFYRGDRAPEYVLFYLETIDGRLPASDDALAFMELLWRYRPVLVEQSFLLLRRGARAGPVVGPVVHEQTFRFGEEVPLDRFGTGKQILALDIRYSLWGKARKFLFRPALLYLRVRLDDGQTRTYRLLPALAREGFLLHPFLEDQQDIRDWYRGTVRKRVRSLCITASADGSPTEAPACFQEEVRLVLRSVNDPVP
jgi:hypothetical protein